MFSFGFDSCTRVNSPLVNRLINDTLLDAYCLTTFQSDTTSNLIRWFAVFNFSKNIKQAGDGIFSGASLCNKLSQYGVILQSYCTNKEGCNFYASQCGDDHDSDWLPEKKTLTENCPPSYKGTRGYQVATGPRRRFPSQCWPRGVARNLFRRGTKEWVPSPAGSIQARSPGGVFGKAPKTQKICWKFDECHRFHTVQTKKFSVAISERTCRP